MAVSSTSACQSRDRRPHAQQSERTSSAATSGWPRGTVRQPRSPRARRRPRAARNRDGRTAGLATVGGVRGRAPAGMRLEDAPRPGRGPDRVDVADDDQDGTVGPVVLAVEVASGPRRRSARRPRASRGSGCGRDAAGRTTARWFWSSRPWGELSSRARSSPMTRRSSLDFARVEPGVPHIRSASIARASSQRSEGKANQ